ncbi:MAG: hypothetical protein M1400_00520 [Patescibacteria group bacterium]|nr:hypothetical protein [Patescibacteria group bacterium]
MKYLAYILWLAVLTGLNFGVFGNLAFFSTVPNLLLLFVIFTGSLKADLFERLFVALMAGLFADYWNGGFFGGFTLAFILLILLLQAVRSAFSLRDMDWKYFFAVFFLAYVFVGLTLWAYNFVALRSNWTEYYISFLGFLRKWPGEMLYNLVLLYPTKRYYDFVQKINRRYLEIGQP